MASSTVLVLLVILMLPGANFASGNGAGCKPIGQAFPPQLRIEGVYGKFKCLQQILALHLP